MLSPSVLRRTAKAPLDRSPQRQTGGNHETPPKSTVSNSPLSILLRQGSDPERKTPAPAGSAPDRRFPSPSRLSRDPFERGNAKADGQEDCRPEGHIRPRNEKLTDYGDVVSDHINPRGMGGAWRDDHPENIQAVHWWCNGEKGSSRG